jgi:hypothetical protein
LGELGAAPEAPRVAAIAAAASSFTVADVAARDGWRLPRAGEAPGEA